MDEDFFFYLLLHSDIQLYMFEPEYTEELHQRNRRQAQNNCMYVFQNYTEPNNWS